MSAEPYDPITRSHTQILKHVCLTSGHDLELIRFSESGKGAFFCRKCGAIAKVNMNDEAFTYEIVKEIQ